MLYKGQAQLCFSSQRSGLSLVSCLSFHQVRGRQAPLLPSLFCFTFSRCTVTVLPSSISQELSSTFTSLKRSPSITGEWPFRPTLRCRLWMSTTTSFPFSRKLTLKGMASWTRQRSDVRSRAMRFLLALLCCCFKAFCLAFTRVRLNTQ